jgi:hypothetical protein
VATTGGGLRGVARLFLEQGGELFDQHPAQLLDVDDGHGPR